MIMSALRILVVEDSQMDFELLKRAFHHRGLECSVQRVDGADAFEESLKNTSWDAIICDVDLPGFSAAAALDIYKRHELDIPFIVISGVITEENAIPLLRAGGHDFILKDNLARLIPALKRELKEADERCCRRIAENSLRKSQEELQLAYEMISRSEAKYRSLFNDALDMIHIVDHNGIILDANPIEFKKLGYTKEEFFGKTLMEIVHPAFREKTGQALGQVMEGVEVQNYETVLLVKDGDSLDVEVNAVPFVENGKVVSARAIIRDITERKRAEEQLKKSKEEWEKTFQAIGDIATIQDLNQRIILANRKACDIFSAQPDELEGKTCYELFQGTSEPCEGCPVLKCEMDFGVHTAEIENKKLHKTYLVSASPIFDKQGDLSRIVHFAKDITDQKKLEEQLRQAQKMEAIGTLASGIAHDFNNILTPILGYADMALETIPPDNPAFTDIQEVHKAGNRAKELVKQILTFSSQVEQQIQPLKIQYVIKEALRLLRASIPTTIEIKQHIDQGCVAVLATPTQIHQIVMNLCTNAYHAMRETGGVLGVSVNPIELGPHDLTTKVKLKEGLYIQLEVSDTGHGMDKIVLDRIFEPYYTTKGTQEGTGLGLSVVHGIVKSLHGDIYVYSEPGAGTAFCIYFPVVNEGAKEGAGAQVALPLPTGEEHILVLDDEKVLVQVERQMLESLGYQVSAFTDCEEALKAFRTKPDSFDLIITDMAMPKITGVKLAQEVFVLRPDFPIILCTGFIELITEEKAKALGISEFIMKPVIKRNLAKAVRKVLDAS